MGWRGLIIVVIALQAQGVQARQIGPCDYPTIEYFIADSDLVVRGIVSKGPVVLKIPKVKKSDRSGNPNDDRELHYEKLSVKVAETLKRDPNALATDPTGQMIDFIIPQADGRSPGQAWDGKEILLSLRTTTRWKQNEKADDGLARWVVRLEWGSDINHGGITMFWWAYDLSSNELPAYDISGAGIPRGDDVLAAARRASQFVLQPYEPDDTFYWHAGTSRPFVELRPLDLSDHYLFAPIDSRLEAQARQWIGRMLESEWASNNAVSALEEIRAPNSAQTVEMLKTLAVNAPMDEKEWEGEGRWRIPKYSARRWARRVLLRWKTPPGDWSRSFENRLPLTPIRISCSLLLLVPVGLFMSLRWYRRRSRLPFGLVSGALTVLLILSLLGWLRSYWRIDEFWLGPGATRNELVSVAGRLQLLTIRHWDEPYTPVYGTSPRTGDLDRALAFESILPDSVHHGTTLAVQYADGDTPPWPREGKLLEWVPTQIDEYKRQGHRYSDWPRGRGDEGGLFGGVGGRGGGGLFGGGGGGQPQGTSYPFRYISIPWAYLSLLGFLGPLAWKLSYWRFRRRRFKGLCGQCGYDLRATPIDRPCPECGAVRNERIQSFGISSK